jgi:hypothetical protein
MKKQTIIKSAPREQEVDQALAELVRTGRIKKIVRADGTIAYQATSNTLD